MSSAIRAEVREKRGARSRGEAVVGSGAARKRVAAKSDEGALVHVERVEREILVLRGQRVMLDADLARLYGVTTGNLNLAVRRNRNRFPADFMFPLTPEEAALLLQSARPKSRGGRRTLPFAFTDYGVAMLSSVLKSERAVEVNVAIMRAFARLREMAMTHPNLARRLDGLERKYDARFQAIFVAIGKLIAPAPTPVPPRRRLGFHSEES